MKKSALIFGYNDYSSHIAKNVLHKYEHITVFKFESDEMRNDLDDITVETFDLSDEWEDLAIKHNISESIVFCVLEDNAQNIFLTISLRAAFENLTIIALSNNKENANKLTMAGANKVIPLVQTTASMITEMLDKPIITKVLHNILYEKSELKVAQIEIKKHDYFDGKYPSEVEWSKAHGIIVLSIMHEDSSHEFIYSSRSKHHAIKKGDVFVVVGYENDINEFKKLIGDTECQLEL